MVQAVIFDMDGVLIDSQPMHYLGDQKTLAAYGVDVPVTEMAAYAGTTNKYRFGLFKEKYDLTEDIDTIIARRENIMIDIVTSSSAVPTRGMVELLQDIKGHGLKTAVASSSSYPFIYAVLRKLDIEKYFDLIFSGESVPNGKPAPDVFLEACRKLGEQPSTCVVVEDSSNGVLAARRAGMICIGYQNPTSGEQDLSQATMVIDDFRNIDVDSICRL